MPGSMKKFNKKRKRDINLEIPVSDKNEKLVYYSFNEPALNGFSKELSNERNNINSYRITSEIEMVTKTMEQILDEHLPKEQKIDFLSIDVEGLDFQVLKSNNWGKYKPNFILIEILDYYDKDISSINKSKVYNFLFDKGYICVAKTFNTFFFKLF
jgi:FkbM family methyltransferase